MNATIEIAAENGIPRPKAKRLAPGPRGSLLMGNLAEYKRDPIDMLLRLRREYGDVVRNRLGPFLTHALAHPDHVQYVLQENHRNYVRGRFYDNFKIFFGNGLLTTEGEFWKRHRRVVQPGFDKKQLDAMTGSVGEAAMDLVERWRRTPDGVVDAVPAMMHLSLAALGRMVFNTDISHTAEQVGPAVRFGLEAMMPQGNHNDFIPRWVPTPFNLRIRQARGAIDRVIAKVIDNHRTGRCGPSDVISLLLASRDPETGAPMTETEVHDEVMTIFLAGHETTGSGLAWALYALAQHPGVARKLREELAAKLGGRPPSAADLAGLPYLDQVVNEALRVYPPIWGYTRDLVEDDEIGGFHIPAGSSIFVSPYVTHRHPDFWSNPEAFDPENFGSYAPARHKYAFFPFGGGMRKCIGYQMALVVMRVVIATVVQHLDLAAVPGHPIARGALVALRPLHGVHLAVRPYPGPGAGGGGPRTRAPRKKRNAAEQGEAGTDGEPASSPTAARCPVEPVAAASNARWLIAAGADGAAGRPAQPMAAASATRCPVAAETDGIVGCDRQPGATEVPAASPIDFAAMPAPSAAAGSALRFTWFPVETEAPPAAPAPDLAGKHVIVVNGLSSSAERVAHSLVHNCVHTHVFAPAPDADIEAAAHALVRQVGQIDGIVDLSVEEPFAVDRADAWEAPMRRTVALLHACYDDWFAEDNTARRFYVAVTWMDGRMGYGDASVIRQPLGGLWAGLAKTLPQELPNCNVRIIDLARDEAANAGARIAAELYRWGLFEIGYCGGRRYTLQARRADLPAAPPPVSAGDVVLLSGGARGIGLLCARAIAERHGATVVITGREPPARGDEPWAKLDDAAFKRYARDQLCAATPENPVVAIRRAMAALDRRRELRATLDAIAAEGLPIQYRVCDVTDAAAVHALCDEFGDRLRIVIHNAGVDRPVRLAQKSADEFLGVVRAKVQGFANLCAAVADRPDVLRFCNVGSLTGRWGGMTGETDYAAANEALARLGLWAQANALRCPVKTLAWPTWDGVGMITNASVTKQYVATMAVEDGVRHWLADLADDRSGEVMFMGAVGGAVTPVQIKGSRPVIGLPGIEHLATRLHHLGEPERFRPFAKLVTCYRIDSDHAQFLHAYRFDGLPALPISILLEHACGANAWIRPDPIRAMALTGLADVRADLQAAALPSGGAADVRTEATGYWAGDEWRVDVRCTMVASARDVLRVTLVHREGPVCTLQEPLAAVRLAGVGAPAVLPSLHRAAWNAHVLPAATWRRLPDGELLGQVACARAADLWALPQPPTLQLPINHLENILRATMAGQADAGAAVWSARRVSLTPHAGAAAVYIATRGVGDFAVTDQQGRVLMEMAGVSLSAHDASNDASAAAAPACVVA